MADSYIQVPPDSTGKLLDMSALTTTSGTVQRERVILGDNTTAANYASINASGQLSVIDAALTNATQKTQLIDASANVIVSTTNGLGRALNTFSYPYLQMIAEGDIANHKPWTKLGLYTNVAANTETDIWGYGGIYSWITTPLGLEVLSSDNTQVIVCLRTACIVNILDKAEGFNLFILILTVS